MEFLIRKAEPRDVPELMGLFSELSGHETTEADVRDRLRMVEDSPIDELYVFEQEDQIQGVLGFRIRENIEERSRYGEISAIAIKHKARKLGIGSLLMEFAENRARELGCKGTWLVSGFGREETAHQFYTKLGYGGVDAALWELFRRTGTTHLMSISGLHVSLVSGLVYAVVAWLWRRVGRLAGWLLAQHAGAWGAVAAALGHSALAGFSVLTQRSLLMGAVVLGSVLLRRVQRTALVLALALLAVLLANPLAVLAVDFWLSFGAVAVILVTALGRRPRSWRDRLSVWARVQLAITFAMAPWDLMFNLQPLNVYELFNKLEFRVSGNDGGSFLTRSQVGGVEWNETQHERWVSLYSTHPTWGAIVGVKP